MTERWTDKKKGFTSFSSGLLPNIPGLSFNRSQREALGELFSTKVFQKDDKGEVIIRGHGLYEKVQMYPEEAEEKLPASVFIFYDKPDPDFPDDAEKDTPYIACLTDKLELLKRCLASALPISPSTHCKKFVHNTQRIRSSDGSVYYEMRTMYFVANAGIYDPKTRKIYDMIYDGRSVTPSAPYSFEIYNIYLPINFSSSAIYVYDSSNIYTFKYRQIEKDGGFELYLDSVVQTAWVDGAEGVDKAGVQIPAVPYASGEYYTAYSPPDCYEVVLNPYEDQEVINDTIFTSAEGPRVGFIATTSPGTFEPRRTKNSITTTNTTTKAPSSVYYHGVLTKTNKNEIRKVYSGEINSTTIVRANHGQYTVMAYSHDDLSDEEWDERVWGCPNPPGDFNPLPGSWNYITVLSEMVATYDSDWDGIWNFGRLSEAMGVGGIPGWFIRTWHFDSVIQDSTGSSSGEITSTFDAPYSMSGITDTIYPNCLVHIQSDTILLHAFGLGTEAVPGALFDYIFLNNVDVTNRVEKILGVSKDKITGMTYLPNYPLQ